MAVQRGVSVWRRLKPDDILPATLNGEGCGYYPILADAARQVVESAGRALVPFSASEMQGEGDIVHDKAWVAIAAGATGLIFGPNIWRRPFDEALKLSQEFHTLIKEHGLIKEYGA